EPLDGVYLVACDCGYYGVVGLARIAYVHVLVVGRLGHPDRLGIIQRPGENLALLEIGGARRVISARIERCVKSRPGPWLLRKSQTAAGFVPDPLTGPADRDKTNDAVGDDWSERATRP